MATKTKSAGRPRKHAVDPQSQRVGQAVRRARLRAKLTPGQAAERAGISLSQWQRIESGDTPLLARFERVAQALGVEPATLLRSVRQGGTAAGT